MSFLREKKKCIHIYFFLFKNVHAKYIYFAFLLKRLFFSLFCFLLLSFSFFLVIASLTKKTVKESSKKLKGANQPLYLLYNYYIIIIISGGASAPFYFLHVFTCKKKKTEDEREFSS